MRYLLLYSLKSNDMGILGFLRRTFKTQSSADEAHSIKNEITREVLKTSVRLNEAKAMIKQNTDITRKIARSIGAL